MTAIDEAWNVAKQDPYNDAIKLMVDSYLHGLERMVDSLDGMVMSDYLDMGNRPMLEDEDNHTMADTTFLKDMVRVAKSEVLRKLRGA